MFNMYSHRQKSFPLADHQFFCAGNSIEYRHRDVSMPLCIIFPPIFKDVVLFPVTYSFHLVESEMASEYYHSPFR